MARVTAIEVKEIMEGCTVENTIVQSFIIGASAIVDKVFAGDVEVGTVLLKEIERWLTAHMIASTSYYRTTEEEKLGEAQVKYTGKFGENLSSTPYGQMVKTLDVSGKMTRYVGKASASMRSIKSFDTL